MYIKKTTTSELYAIINSAYNFITNLWIRWTSNWVIESISKFIYGAVLKKDRELMCTLK